MLHRRHLLASAALLPLCSRANPATPTTPAEPRVATVAHGLVHPWGLAFLPDGRLLVTERPGRLRTVAPDGRLGPPLAGLPPVEAEGQGGLLDVVVAPDFAQSQRVLWSYAEPGTGADAGSAGTAVASGRLQGDRLTDVAVLFRQTPKVAARQHFGCRLVWARDGSLLITLGDRGIRRDDAQNLGNHLGKIIRLRTDGSVPADNPFVGQAEARPEIWSYGHRNVQGAALHPTTGELYATEHGPQGGDELNRVQRGANHGWPLVTYGRNYGSGTRIGEPGPRPGVVMPLRHWVPTSIGPSGLAFVTGTRYPGWQGSLLLGALRDQALWRLVLDGDTLRSEQRLLGTLNERIRDVRQGPDGYVYLLTDNADGRILRLMPT